MQKRRFAHEDCVWASTVCRSVDLHTGPGFRASAVCRSADLHTRAEELGPAHILNPHLFSGKSSSRYAIFILRMADMCLFESM